MRKLFFIFMLVSVFNFKKISAQTISFIYKGNNRTCKVHLPPGYSPSNNYPLVFNLHGHSSNSAQEEFYTQMDAIADTAHFIVAYPDAVGGNWDTKFINSPVDDIGYINALLDTLEKDYSLDSCRIYSCGMSMGGFMTYRLGSQMTQRLAAIASVAGPVTDSVIYFFNTSPRIPVMHIHGTADGTIPYAGDTLFWDIDTTIQYFINKNGCQAAPVVYNFPNTTLSDSCTVTSYNYTGCLGSTDVLFYKVSGGGHTWPGALFDITNLGNTNHDISISAEIWKFFRKYNICSNTSVLSPFSAALSVLVFPNPFSESATLEIKGTSPQYRVPESGNNDLKLLIYDVFGKMVLKSEIRNCKSFIRRGNLPEGIYFYQIISENKSISTGKLIILP